LKEDKIAVTWPKISVLMPVHRPPFSFLKKAIQSVIKQDYKNWQLCIIDDGSRDGKITSFLEKKSQHDSRIIFRTKVNSEGIAVATNCALDIASGEWIVFLDHDDLLAVNALSEIAKAISAKPSLKLIYSDEDKILPWFNLRYGAYYKPDWSPDLLLCQNYLCHLVALRTDLAKEIGGLRCGFDGAQDWDFLLRATERCESECIHHIPKVLYHWRSHWNSTAWSLKAKSHSIDCSIRLLSDACVRRKINIQSIEKTEIGGHLRIKRALHQPAPLVSVIIPIKNKPELLIQALKGLRERTDYKNLEILVVDNDSDDPQIKEILSKEKSDLRVIHHGGNFNYSAINNHAVKHANGDIILMLNNDVEPLESGWLNEMVSHAVRDEIGAVGALLLYPDGRVQHAGVTLGIAGPMRVGGVAGHPGKRMHPTARIKGNLLRVTRNVSAVTGACLAIKKTIYEKVNGLNEVNLPVAFNDVDFCIRVMMAGYRNLWTPHARLIHHESLSRGSENTPEKKARFKSEISYMRQKWGDLLDNDPYYNPNLTLVRENWAAAS
jgi:glycosyltransferase involved in cell wall biosynthesis